MRRRRGRSRRPRRAISVASPGSDGKVRPPRGGNGLPMLEKLKRGLANGAVSAVAFVLTYLVCEFVFFRLMLPEMSYNIRPHLPDRADFFLQNAKSHYVPHVHIALLGDSYAAGVGDW